MLDVQRVNDGGEPTQNTSHTNTTSTTPTSSTTTMSDPQQGRDSRIGAQSFDASVVKARIQSAQLADPLRDPQKDNGPKTFTAEDKVPDRVFPGEGRTGANATPQEVANFIRGLEFSPAGDGQQAQAQFFTQALADHKNQPEWTQQFFKALGSSKTAEIMQNALTPGQFKFSSKADFEKSVSTIRDAVAGLAQRPDLFNQADMNLLVGKMSDQGFNRWTASELFGKMSWQNEGVKNMFFTAAVNKALDSKTGGGARSALAAAASNVLASTSMDNQAVQLNNLRKSGQLTSFVQSAMSGPQQAPTLWSAVESVQRSTPVNNEDYARVDGLLLNASLVDVRDSFDRAMPISSSDLTATRTQLFNAAAQALTDSRVEGSFKDNDTFKDAMTRIFTNQFDSIINSGLGTNGAGFDILKFQPGLEKFFQSVLFTQHPTLATKDLSNFLADRLSKYGQGLMDTKPGAEQRFRDQFGRSRIDAAAISGGLLGMMTNALRASKDELNKDNEAKAGAIKFVVDVAFGFIPGIGGKLAEGVDSTIAKTLIEKTLGPVQDKVLGLIKDGAVDQAKQLLLDQFKGKDPEAAFLGLFNALNQTIPNGDEHNEPNFLTQFESSYSTAVNSPYRITR
jgi:hypothetical protein